MRTPWIAALLVPLIPFVSSGSPQSSGTDRSGGRTSRAPQDPEQEPQPEPNWRTNPEERAEYYREQLVGAWQLTQTRSNGVNYVGRQVAGFAIFAEGYMSIELHLLISLGNNANAPYFQSGIHRWNISSLGELETSSMIGNSNFNQNLEFNFEPRGTSRRYKLDLQNNELVLRRADGNNDLTFVRIGSTGFPGAGTGAPDFYGRRKPR